MIRSFLKDKARQAAIKLLNMEYDTVDRDPNARKSGNPSSFDPAKIPKIVDGDGDTPGPNHKEDIGRTYASAQLAGGKGVAVVDIRTPLEYIGGILPGALLMPKDRIKDQLAKLPEDKSFAIIVYDQTGEHGSIEIAQWLRDQGYSRARRLQGGFAEWIEHGETIQQPHQPEGAQKGIGDPMRAPDNREGWVLEIVESGQNISYLVWLDSGEVVGPLEDKELDG